MTLRERREQLGMTQAEVANKANIAKSTYCNLENGTRNPSIDMAMALANVYGCRWYEIVEECRNAYDAGSVGG